MPGNRTLCGRSFYNIHRAMRTRLEELISPFSCWAEYYRCMYIWFPEFRDDLKNLENRDPTSAREYLSRLSYGGLLKIDLNEMAEWDKGIGLPLKKVGARNVPLLLKNSDKNIALAEEYLKQFLLERFSHSGGENEYSAIEEKGRYVAEAGLDIIKENHPDHANYIRNFVINNHANGFKLWAIVIIYAQCQKLPQERRQEQFNPPNIFMASKGEIQAVSPLENRCGGAKRLLIINFAGTAFLAAERITNEVKNAWSVFLHNLLSGGTDVDIVLTDPTTPAARDAEKYKMRPYTLNTPLDKIIRENIRDLEYTMMKYTDSNINLYLTDIALPCAYLKAEFDDDPSRDNIKIDLYLPSFATYAPNAIPEDECDDKLRQSFVIFRESNPSLYEVFSKNMERILEHSKKYNKGDI